jgi:hypothetical protein
MKPRLDVGVLSSSRNSSIAKVVVRISIGETFF